MKKIFSKIFLYISLSIIAMFTIFPFYWLFNTSLQNIGDYFEYPPNFMPTINPISIYLEYMKSSQILLWMKNTVIVTVIATLISTFLAVLGAYSISRFKYKGKIFFTFMILLTQMLPFILVIIPLYIIFARIHIIDSLYGLIIIYAVVTIPIGIFFLKGFFDSIPKELDEAAEIDGCSKMGILFKIILPLLKPGIIATATWTFIIAWDDFLIASTLIDNQERWVVSIGLASYIGQLKTDLNLIMAGSVIATLIPVILFLYFQKYLVSGLTAGSVKE